MSGAHRYRVLHNTVIVRPAVETFHEFVVSLLWNTFGEGWHRKHLRAPPEHRHMVRRWISAWIDQVQAPPGHQVGDRFSIDPTGEAFCLLMLADDLYRLQLVRRLPSSILERLKRTRSYQGARYEIAVAAVFVRAGCDVTWIEATPAMATCEFTATFPDGYVVAVEAKSRHRSGVLHEHGQQPSDWKADVDNLYRKAVRKDSAGRPLVVFLDINVPHEPGPVPVGEKKWHRDIRDMFKRQGPIGPDNPTPEALLVLTNWSWHLDGSAPATAGEFILTKPDWPKHTVPAAPFRALHASLARYGAAPTDE